MAGSSSASVTRVTRDGTTWYLAKWRDLPYDQATWETGETDDNVIADFEQMVEQYHQLRYECVRLHACVHRTAVWFHVSFADQKKTPQIYSCCLKL